MSEVTFAKGFLATLDKRTIKLPADHVSDPRKHANQSPYTLPRTSHPFPRKGRTSAAQQAQEKTITATLKPMRSGDAVSIPDVPLDTTVHDLKTQYAQKAGQAQDKIKLLLNKKPAADLKTLKELGVDKDIELSVMVMGAAATTPGATPAVEKTEPLAAAPEKMDVDEETPAPLSERAQAEGEKRQTADDSAAAILKTEEFWTDLTGFLTQRLRDEGESKKLVTLFRESGSRR